MLAILVMVVAAGGPARAQQGEETITLNGALTATRPEAEVRVRTRAGVQATITLVSADFDPVLGVYDSAGEIVAVNDDNDTDLALPNRHDSAVIFTPAFSQTLTVRISSFTPGETGRYTLTLQGVRVIEQVQPGVVTDASGTLVEGTLLPAEGEAAYAFRAPAGAGITLTVSSAEFDTVLEVRDSAGEPVATNDDHGTGVFLPHTTDSAVSFTASGDGVYTVAVRSYDPQQGGRFTLTIEGAEFGLGESAVGRLRGAPPYIIDGELGVGQPYLEYRLYAAEGAELTATLVSSAFNPVLEVYSADGVRLADNDDHGPAFDLPSLQDAALRLTFSQAGMIAVRVRSFAGGGPFTLTLDGSGIAAEAPSGPPLPPCEDVSSASVGGSIIGFSSEFGGRWRAQYLIDGSDLTGWASGAGTAHARTEYVILDLAGGLQTIDGIRINPAATGGDSDVNNVSRFAVLVSTTDPDKPESFVEVFSTLLSERVSRTLAFAFEPVAARYVMLQTRDNFGGSWHSVAEFTVCAAETP